MKKKIISIILAAAAAISALPMNISAEPTDIRIFLNGNEMYLSDNVEVFNDLTMVPAKNFMEGLGYYVEWNELFQTLTASKISNGFVFNVNNSEYTINGNIKHTNAIPAIIRNRVYISLDDVVRDIGLSYIWDNDNRIISIEGEIINPTPAPLVILSNEQIPQNLFDKNTSNNTAINIGNKSSNNKSTLSERLRPKPKTTSTPAADETLKPTDTPNPQLSPSPTPIPTPTPTAKPVSPYKCYERYPTVPDIKDVIIKLDFLYFENTPDSSTYYYSFARNDRDNIKQMYNDALIKSGFDKNNSESSNKINVYDRYNIKVIFNEEKHSITIKGTPKTIPSAGSDNIFAKNNIPQFTDKKYNNPIPFYEAYLDNRTYVYKFVTTEDDAKNYTGVLKKNDSTTPLYIGDTKAEFMFKDMKITTQLLDYDEKIIQAVSATPAPSATPVPTSTPTPTEKPKRGGYKKLGITSTPVPTSTPMPTSAPEISPSPTAAPLLDLNSIDEKDRKIFVIKIIP